MIIFRDENGTGGSEGDQGQGDQGQGDQGQKPTLQALIKEHGLQDEVNTMMSENRRNLTKQNTELVTQLSELKQDSRLTQEERDDLQTKITQLEEQYMSKDELAKREAAKVAKQYATDLSTAKETSEQWQSRFTSSTIERALFDAAFEGEAEHPEQIVTILRTHTQLVEDNGRFSPIVKFNDIDEDGKNVVLDLSPVDAVKRMKELPDKHGNLFKGTARGGLGESGGSNGSTSQPKLSELTDDPVKYAKWRKDNPDLDISKLRR